MHTLSNDKTLRHVQTLIIAWGETALPYPPAPTTTTAACLAKLCDDIQLHAGYELTPDRRDRLLLAILDYLPPSDNHDITEERRRELLLLGGALRQDPACLDRAVPARSLIAGQRFLRNFHGIKLRADAGEGPPRRCLWQSPDGYRFEEATHPAHLQQDTLTLGHCIGATHDLELLNRHGIYPEDPAADVFLVYWLRIQRRYSRIITFTRNRMPVATLEYDIKSGWITRIETAAQATVLRGADYFPAFCAGLAELCRSLPINFILRMPDLPDGLVLTPRGTLEEPTPLNILSALTGKVPLPADPVFVPLWTENSRLTIDITKATSAQKQALPPVIRSSWMHHDATSSLDLPQIVEARIRSWTEGRIKLPKHTNGDITAPNAQSATLATREGAINLSSIKSVILSAHVRGRVTAHNSVALLLANHRRGGIDAPKTKSLAAPRMEEGNISTAAEFLSLPHFRSGDIHAPAAKVIYAPKWLSGGLHAPKARKGLTAPRWIA